MQQHSTTQQKVETRQTAQRHMASRYNQTHKHKQERGREQRRTEGLRDRVFSQHGEICPAIIVHITATRQREQLSRMRGQQNNRETVFAAQIFHRCFGQPRRRETAAAAIRLAEENVRAELVWLRCGHITNSKIRYAVSIKIACYWV